ncbi:MAG: hypothetical protein DBX00_09840 [Verrucomicrobia bacterium]|nr:MAG: hypothetical protein DBX00_09840 [Verrucomicrobiota bacterium]
MFPSFARGQNEPISDHFSLKEAFTTGNLDAVITDPATPGVPQRAEGPAVRIIGGKLPRPLPGDTTNFHDNQIP